MKHPTVITIISGKGGVGKTTLTISLAQELSRSNKTVLMVDLDFHNRGLSELVEGDDSSLLATLDGPLSLHAQNQTDNSKWPLLKLNDGIYSTQVPKVSSQAIHELENLGEDTLLDKISAFVNQAIGLALPDVILLDCHGSGDSISHVAAKLSDHVLVVSTPELITFFGTRKLVDEFQSKEYISTDRCPRFHLVFNRVGSNFSASLLKYWYKLYFRDGFADEMPLAIIPSDERISIASAESIFHQELAYYSVPFEKIRILLYKLLFESEPELVNREAKFVGRILKPFFTSRDVPLSGVLDSKIPIKTIVFVFSVMFGLVIIGVTFPSFPKYLYEIFGIKVPDAILLVLASYIFLFTFFFWAILATITSSIIGADDKASSCFRRIGGKRRCVNGFYSCFIVALGLVFLSLLSFNEHNPEEFKKVIGGIKMPLLLSGMEPDLIKKVVGFFEHLFAGIDLTMIWGARIFLSLFCLVFLLRFFRTVYFRLESTESLYRISICCLFAWIVYSNLL